MESWQAIDRAAAVDARSLLARCCGSTRWVERMLAARPFGSQGALLAAARETWFALAPVDWLEAFGHHPKIGDRHGLATRFAASGELAAREQRGVETASDAVLDELAAGNAAYERKFGYIFIVCATGKGADEMLALLRARLPNDPATEIHIAAEEQARITALRLQQMK
jgi:2-oxo-4-hydroxy-4-carboxy-5-ureidoimidazoline decarboxylase